jgi:riboflavin synthase
MFTGIIKETGKVIKVEEMSDGKSVSVQCPLLYNGLAIGDSVCVNGCCLTVRKLQNQSFDADISFATVASTTFKTIKTGYPVNLEDSLRPSDRLGGHFVTGHIDDTAEIIKIEKIGQSYLFLFKVDEKLIEFLAPKGSVSVDGISLTIADFYTADTNNIFSAAVIPHTFENTTMKFKKAGDMVNMEVDLIARYIRNLIRGSSNNNNADSVAKDRILEVKLRENGFFE